MYKVIWTFKIAAENQTRFEEIYSPRGQWAQLFSKTDGYLGTELFQDFNEDLSYATIDTWRTAEDFQKFKIQWQDEYEALGKQCDLLTETSTRIGSFLAIS